MNITDEEFYLLSYYLNHSCGIDIANQKRYLFEVRMNDLLIELGLTSYKEFLDILLKDKDGNLTKRLIEVMTTNETSFFRDGHPFDNFENVLLPGLIKDKMNSTVLPFKLKIWSAGCSCGQEPYTISMIIHEWLRKNDKIDKNQCTITATDISSKVLEKAKQGIFENQEVKRGLSDYYKDKYFTETENLWHVNEELKEIIEFKELNLSRKFDNIPEKYDFIFCRNVIIYFSKELKKSIIKQFHNMLYPWGILIMGTQENLYNISDDFISDHIDNTIIYRVKK